MDRLIVSNDEIIDQFIQIDNLRFDYEKSQHKIEILVKLKQDEIIKKMAVLVYSNTKPYRSFSNYEDILQEGHIGLIHAVRRFDWSRFPNFFVYAARWIRYKVKRAASRFDIVYNPNRNRVVYSGPDEDESIPEEKTPEGQYFAHELRHRVNLALNNLSQRDRDVMQRAYGLGEYEQQSLREIGPKLNLTHERVRQIRNTAIKKLSKHPTLIELNMS